MLQQFVHTVHAQTNEQANSKYSSNESLEVENPTKEHFLRPKLNPDTVSRRYPIENQSSQTCSRRVDYFTVRSKCKNETVAVCNSSCFHHHFLSQKDNNTAWSQFNFILENITVLLLASFTFINNQPHKYNLYPKAISQIWCGTSRYLEHLISNMQ